MNTESCDGLHGGVQDYLGTTNVSGNLLHVHVCRGDSLTSEVNL